MTDRQIEQAMRAGWNKAMGPDPLTAEPYVFDMDGFSWYMFGHQMGASVRELKGIQPAPKINTPNFTDIELDFFKGGKQ